MVATAKIRPSADCGHGVADRAACGSKSMQPADTARIWAAQETFACPGRVRLDADNPARENLFPGYKDGADVNLKVGVLRVGDINFGHGEW